MIILCHYPQSEGPDQCSQPEDMVSWWLLLCCYGIKYNHTKNFQTNPFIKSEWKKHLCSASSSIMLFYSHREWLRWLTAGGIQCWFCPHCLKRVQPARSSLPTTPTVWGWVPQALPATCLWPNWGQTTAEPSCRRVSPSVWEEWSPSPATVSSAILSG